MMIETTLVMKMIAMAMITKTMIMEPTFVKTSITETMIIDMITKMTNEVEHNLQMSRSTPRLRRSRKTVCTTI